MLKILSTIFHFISIVIAVLLSGLFVATTVLSILLLNVDQTLLDAETWKRALAENNIYEQAPALVAEQFESLATFIKNPCARNPLACEIDGASPELQACLNETLGAETVADIGSFRRAATEEELQKSQPCLDQFGRDASQPGPEAGAPEESAGGPPTFLSNLAPDDWQAIVNLLLPPDDLQSMTEATLDGLFAYLNAETDTVTVPLGMLKDRLAGQAGEDLVRLVIQAQPPCTDEQLARINAGDIGDPEKPPLVCNATGDALERLVADLLNQLDSALARMPDEAIIVKPPSADEPAGDFGPLGKDPRSTLLRIRLAMRLSPLVPFALLLLVTLFGVRSVRGWLRWWGALLLISGLLALALGLAALPALNWAWAMFLVPRLPTLFASSTLIPTVHSILNSVTRGFVMWINIEAAVLVLLGLGGVFGIFGDTKQTPAAPKPLPPKPQSPKPEEPPSA